MGENRDGSRVKRQGSWGEGVGSGDEGEGSWVKGEGSGCEWLGSGGGGGRQWEGEQNGDWVSPVHPLYYRSKM